ncbi:hypothetical protein [Methylophilus sp. Q8]|uniref:hypothetical protein n=1 Tax=Methylophilus sp. Q8 TaxID=1506586 RepID=UPI001269B223|nr:hypothetical protein [Methylophilus sp. Q8]
MKSVLSKVFACSVLMLASVAANATVDPSTPMHVIVHADLNLLALVAAADDDQADNSEAETMLA